MTEADRYRLAEIDQRAPTLFASDAEFLRRLLREAGAEDLGRREQNERHRDTTGGSDGTSRYGSAAARCGQHWS